MAEKEPIGTAKPVFCHKKRHFYYSLTHMGILSAALLLCIALFVIALISLYYQKKYEEQYLDYMVRIQSQLNNETATTFSMLEQQLFQLGQYNTNVSLINTTTDSLTFYRAKMTLYRELSYLASVFPETDGLFLYSPTAEDYTPYLWNVSSGECSEYIRDYLADNREHLDRLGGMQRRWQLVQLSGDSYLVRYITTGSSILGGWTSISTLLRSFRDVLPEENIIGFLDQEHRLLQSDIFPDYAYDSASAAHYQRYCAPDGTDYMVNTYPTSYSDCDLIVFMPLSMLTSQFSMVYKGSFMMSVVIILIVLTLSIIVRRLIELPVRAVRHTLTALQDGRKDALQLRTDSRCLEARQIVHVLNDMLGEIQTLEAQVYEDQLAQSRLEVQFLKSQISPHFLINCLNTFSYLAASPAEQDRAAAQRLTQTLSQHIRYSFVSRETIPLDKEFDHLDNYLELAFIRYPDSLSYELALSPECEAAQIPPMTLLTLCENTVKHNLIIGERLKIRVSAVYEEDDVGGWAHICFIDSGTGYTPEVLVSLNHLLEHPEYARDGQHIGLYNIVKASHLVYKDKASFTFSNEPGAGARVDIRVPFARKEEP